MEIRNIANIAHVDHGKTTLIDAILKATGAISTRVETAERIMDSNDQERERGITIFSKNASVNYKGTKINIVDTPGHADFGSEVERVLRSVDAALLLVDAFEGPMPQTRFVLGKALEIGLKMLVVINKIDRPMARPDAVLDMTLDLFDNLGASDEQLDFPYIFTIARDGVAVRSLDDPHEDITPLLDFIMEHVKPAAADAGGIFRMQPATLAYDNYVGRIAVGRVYEGRARGNTPVYVIGTDGARRAAKITRIYSFEGLERVEAKRSSRRRHRRHRGHSRYLRRRNNNQQRGRRGAACHQGRSSDGRHVVSGQQLAFRGPRGKICNQPPYSGPPYQRNGIQRRTENRVG